MSSPRTSRLSLSKRSRDRRRSPMISRSRSVTLSSARKPAYNRRKKNERAPSSWDVPPVGYEHITPAQYKKMQANGEIVSRIVSDAVPTGESAAIATITRQARRLYVGNIPFGVTDDDMIAFFNCQVEMLGGSHSDGGPVLSCQTNLEKNFAFLEFRSMDEATTAVGLDGIHFRGQILKIRRPHDYQQTTNVSSSKPTNGLPPAQGSSEISSQVPDSPNKLYVGGVPLCLQEEQIVELLGSFGQLRGFNLVRDNATGLSKGFGFFEYIDPLCTDNAIAGLNGMNLGDRKLVVQRSIAGCRNTQAFHMAVLQVPGLSTLTNSDKPSKVICMLNMVIPEELKDDEEYDDIRTDIKQECNKMGRVSSLKIPRHSEPGCGKVFVKFHSIEDSARALKSLCGRKFSGRIVVTTYFDEEKYKNNDFQ